MARQDSIALVERYYAAFNAGDAETMLACLSDDVAHDINQGGRHVGKAAFREFLAHMDHCYRERLSDIAVMSDGEGGRLAAEFVVHGEYLVTDDGLPEAKGQAYRLPAGAFLTVAGGLITRISVYYNLADWIAQVSAESA